MAALSGVLSACQLDSATRTQTVGSPATSPGSPTAPVLQPGRPGEPNASVTGNAPGPSATVVDPDDTRFMQEMITHHAQAIRIVAVATSLLTDPQVKAIAGRIKGAQGPEIDAMARWLTAHGKRVPPEATFPLMSPSEHHAMPGMASLEQLDALARSHGSTADRLFLRLMIAHHQGALVMALDQRMTGTDDRTTETSDDISVTQAAEIRHMSGMLARLGTGS